ncbi:MAG: hypothetical protein JWO54_706 [Candidatus Saccharibacteria bacterium]|nr:hypothetical protein [Candidatus Saccharibacteria bacterium]
MLSDIQSTIDELPVHIGEVHTAVLELAGPDGLKLPTIDPALYLLKVFTLESTTVSVQWLQSLGLKEEVIICQIQQEFSSPKKAREIRKLRREQRISPAAENYNEATIKMFGDLAEHSRKYHVTSSANYKELLDAILASGSPTVEKIFKKIRMSMAQVKTSRDNFGAEQRKRLVLI